MSIIYNYIWDATYINRDNRIGGWVPMTAAMLGGGGDGGPVTFPASFAVSNFPSSFAVSNFPSSFAVSNFPSSFAISNWPVSQAVTVANFPTSQAVTVSNWPATQAVSSTQLPATLGPLASTVSSSVVVAPDSIVQPLVEVVMTTPTTQVAANRVLADTQVLANAVRVSGGSGKVDTIALIDPDNQRIPMSVVFLRANVSMGAESAAPAITDVGVASYLGHVDILQSDWRDLGGSSVATVNKNITIKAAAGSRDIYVALINTTLAPTFGGGAIHLQLGLL